MLYNIFTGLTGWGTLFNIFNGLTGLGTLYNRGLTGWGTLFNIFNGLTGWGTLFNIFNGLTGWGTLFNICNGLVGNTIKHWAGRMGSTIKHFQGGWKIYRLLTSDLKPTKVTTPFDRPARKYSLYVHVFVYTAYTTAYSFMLTKRKYSIAVYVCDLIVVQCPCHCPDTDWDRQYRLSLSNNPSCCVCGNWFTSFQ